MDDSQVTAAAERDPLDVSAFPESHFHCFAHRGVCLAGSLAWIVVTGNCWWVCGLLAVLRGGCLTREEITKDWRNTAPGGGGKVFTWLSVWEYVSLYAEYNGFAHALCVSWAPLCIVFDTFPFPLF